MNIIKFSVVLIVQFVGAITYAQFQGTAVYQTKTTLDVKLDERQFSPEQRKRIEERMKNNLEKVYELHFNSNESLYKEEESLDQPNQGGGRRFIGFGGGEMYKNTMEKRYSKVEDLMGKTFLVKDSLETLDWQYHDESKIIGQHLCLKATAIKKVPIREEFRFGRGRQLEEQNEEPKDSIREVEIVAWYTLEIPVNHGPDTYWGLPGLILELHADRTQMVCTKITISTKAHKELKEPKKGQEVNQQEFEEIRKSKIEEQREIYGNERRGGGPGGRIGG